MSNKNEVNSIELVTAPVIKYDHVVAEGQKIREYIASLNISEIEPTEENKKLLKETRSDLTKMLADYEAGRKFIKNGVLNPYNEFETVYKDNISNVLNDAISSLKSGVDSIESKQLENKTNGLIAYFDEVNKFDFIEFETLALKINLSASETGLKKEIDEKLSKIESDLKLIESMDNKELILARYEKTLDVTQSVVSVKEELRRAEEIKNAQEESKKVEKAEIKQDVKVEEETLYTMKFSVKGTKAQLGALKQFLIENNIEYKGEQ